MEFCRAPSHPAGTAVGPEQWPLVHTEQRRCIVIARHEAIPGQYERPNQKEGPVDRSQVVDARIEYNCK